MNNLKLAIPWNVLPRWPVSVEGIVLSLTFYFQITCRHQPSIEFLPAWEKGQWGKG